MSSAYPGGGGPDYYGSGGGGGRSTASYIAGNNNSLNPNNLINNNNNAGANNMTAMNQQHNLALLRFQQQRQQQLIQHQHQPIGGILNDPTAAPQIGNRRTDFIGKRSLADFQNLSQISQQLHPQQNQSPYSVLQQQQQKNRQSSPLSLLQQQLYLRSVKQRSNNYLNNTLLTPTYQNHGFDLRSSSLPHEIPSFSSPAATTSARYGVPIYQQRQPVSLNNNNNTNSDYFGNNGPSSLINNNNNRTNPVGHRNQNFGETDSNNGYSNPSPCLTSADESMPAGNDNNNKMMDTLQELEKQLLDDNDEEECDAVSVITSSEWSETFQNLVSPAQTPTTPIQTQNPSQNIISPSPTSSTSSSCSSSASPPTATVPARQLISEAATAISEGKTESAIEILSRLSLLGNPKGNSEQKLVAYMSNALRSRACPKEYTPPVMELFSNEHMESMYMLHDLSLCYKFGVFAANLVILEAVTVAKQEKSRVHVIDFDIGHGGQYMNLLGALGERRIQSGGVNNVELKITAVTTELVNSITDTTTTAMGAEVVKEGLLKIAERVGVNLRFNTVTQSIRHITPESLGCEEGESVVVNFAFKLHRVPDESVSMENLRDELLRRVKGLKPRVVTLVEQEMNGNTAPFMTRVNECVAYYGALFDSLESGLTRDNPERGRVEEGLGRKMMNSVACEGRDRVERCEVYGKWRARMGMAGFELKPLTQSIAESMRTKLNSSEPRFAVKEENGGVYFGWMGRALTVASAWR